VLQAARADSVDAFFVFLDLLKRDAERVCELRLAHVEHEAAHAYAGADVLIGRVSWFSHGAAPALDGKA
jgi:hypothetical protein